MLTLQTRLWALAALAAAGCSPTRVPVNGTVSVAGKPVEAGGIDFLPLDGGEKSTRIGGPIANGSYAIPADRGPLPGKYRVEIFSMESTGKKVDTGDAGENSTVMMKKQVLPPKFNDSSELTTEVTSGTNQIDFDLKP